MDVELIAIRWSNSALGMSWRTKYELNELDDFAKDSIPSDPEPAPGDGSAASLTGSNQPGQPW